MIYAHGEEVGYGEGPACGGADVGDLDVELAPVVVDPAAGDDAGIYAVETDDIGCAEEGVGYQAEHARYAVLGEHIHRIVDADPVFYCERGVSWTVKER